MYDIRTKDLNMFPEEAESVTKLSENGPVLIGDKAPEFTAQTTHGPVNFPKDYEGKWVVLFSHPADFTPVCTTEFVAFAKRWKQFQELGTELIGLSIDQIFSHMKWTEWIKEKLGIEPGTAFEDLPDDWVCPVCGTSKDAFEKVEYTIG